MLKKILQAWNPEWKPDRFKATLIGIVASMIVLPLLLLSIPYLELLNDMAVQPKGKAQGQYGWFSSTDPADQRIVERPPVPGTIPVTYFSHPYPKDSEKDTRFADLSGQKFPNPYATKSKAERRAALHRGEEIFNRICWTCHGKQANGDGPIVGPDLFPAPPTLHSETARKFKDGHIFHVITRGQKKMPQYADVLTPDERWSVILYVRALQLAKQK